MAQGIFYKRGDRRRLRRMLSGLCPNYTGWVALLIILVTMMTFFCIIQIAGAEEQEVNLPGLDTRPTVTEAWQTIQPSKEATITVYWEHPDPLEVGDSISFYCSFEGCNRDEFTYDWQYGGAGRWTSFGSMPRKNATYSSMLAGQQVRLVVSWK